MGQFDGSTIDYHSVLEAVPQPIAVCNIEGDVLFVNAMARQFLELEGKDELPRFGLSERDTFSQVRIEQTGSLKEYFLSDVEVFGAGRDRASLSLSPLGEEHYRVLLEAVPRVTVAPVLDELDALVAICDQRRRIRLSNAALNQLVAEGVDDNTQIDVLELFCRQDRSALRVAASEALAGAAPEEVSARLQGELSGKAQHVRVRMRPFQHQQREGADIQRRGFLLVAQLGNATFERLEEEFARAEELMSLGQMATGVAHELKNPLTSILNYAHYLMEKYRGQFIEESDRKRLQRIIDGVERIDSFVRDLLNLAEADGLSMETIDLHATLKASSKLSRHVLDEHNVKMRWELGDDVPPVNGHDGGLHQVFSNLFLNAARAMPSTGGVIEVRTQHQGPSVIIDVEDTAGGIPQEIRDRIFEPFFSARSDGNGTGLGLALVQRLVEEHGGKITVDSTPGKGSCFRVTLPV